MGIVPNAWNSQEWTSWATDQIVKPIEKAVKAVAGNVSLAIFNPFRTHLGNLRFAQAASLINHPRAALRNQIRQLLPVNTLRFYRIVRSIRDSQVDSLVQILDDYLVRLDSIELAVSALVGTKLPIIEAFSADLHTLLGRGGPNTEFPASVLAMLEEVSDAFESVLGGLQVIAGAGRKSDSLPELAPGHFYDWVCCTTDVDKNKKMTGGERKQQQRLRQTMMKVLLSYIDDVDIGPSRFKAGAQPGKDAKSFGGFALSSVHATSVVRNANGILRAYAGLLAAAFEHIFVSSRPLTPEGPDNPADLYHELPLTLKLQRPDLSTLAFAKAGYSMFSTDLELDSEFLAMRVATTSANVTAGTVRTAINSVGNGIWEISPNNPPLVDTIASLVAIPVYEIEKAILYDLLRRFRVYVTDQTIDMSNEFVIARTSFNVPDFSGGTSTERQLTAAVGVACEDASLLQAVRQLFGNLPISLDDSKGIGTRSEGARLLHGLFRDSLAVGYVISS